MIDNVTGDVPVRPYGRRGRALAFDNRLNLIKLILKLVRKGTLKILISHTAVILNEGQGHKN